MDDPNISPYRSKWFTPGCDRIPVAVGQSSSLATVTVK